jgi:hypothetical protein
MRCTNDVCATLCLCPSHYSSSGCSSAVDVTSSLPQYTIVDATAAYIQCRQNSDLRFEVLIGMNEDYWDMAPCNFGRKLQTFRMNPLVTYPGFYLVKGSMRASCSLLSIYRVFHDFRA